MNRRCLNSDAVVKFMDFMTVFQYRNGIFEAVVVNTVEFVIEVDDEVITFDTEVVSIVEFEI